MVKEIKFDLKLSNVFVSNIEMLKENFYLTDILEYYHSKKLHRWLKVRDHMEILDEINRIEEIDDKIIADKLIKIFDITYDQKYIDEILTIHFHNKKNKGIFEQKESIQESMKKYIEEYSRIIKELIKEKNTSKIKGYIEILKEEYIDLLEVSQDDLLNKILDNKNYIPLLFILAQDKIRLKIKWLENENILNKLKSIIGSEFKIRENISEIKEFKKNTNNIWDEFTNKTILVLSISEGMEIRENEVSRIFYSKDLLFKPRFFKTLEYKSNSILNKIIYLEV